MMFEGIMVYIYIYIYIYIYNSLLRSMTILKSRNQMNELINKLIN